MKTVVKALLLASALIAPTMATAQDYPTKPVTVIIPFGAGSSSDIMGRYVVENLGKLWKQPVVVENRSGAGTAIGAALASKAKPDGYTLMFVSSSYSTNAAVTKTLPFDPVKDFQPISMVASGQMAIFAGTRVPITNMDELIKQAKAQKIFFGSTGPGSFAHFITALIEDRAKIKLEPVSYKAVPEAFIDLGGGRIDMFIASVTSGMATMQSNKAVPIAIAASTRSKLLPNVPTTTEAGLAGVDLEPWWGLFAPAATPPAIVAKINTDVAKIMATQEAKEFFEKSEASVRVMGPAEFTSHLTKEITTLKDVAVRNNLIVN